MAAYLEPGELDNRLPGDVKKNASPDQKDLALEAASREADSYLRAAGYTTPLTTFADESFKKHVAAIATYDLAVDLGLLPEPAEKSAIHLKYKAAIGWFKSLVNGTVSITVTDADGSATPPSQVRISSATTRGW